MEFFIKGKAVRLKSHLNKYLVADDDQVSTRQSRHGAAKKARWFVELVDTNRHVIRLKSCHNRYLAASDEPFLLGMTGHKVLQTTPYNIDDSATKDLSIDWQPIRDGFQVKLKAYDGTYLRANGGTPPWRNSVTHDTAASHGWVVWDVEEVDVAADEAVADYWSMITSFSSVSDEISGLEDGFGSPVSVMSGLSGSASPSPSPRLSMKKKKKSFISITSRTPAMDLFRNAKVVRLKSSHDKYLTAEEDEESVSQGKTGSSKSAKWSVEFVPNSDNIIRLKSCYGKYLTASNHPFLLGMTGRKVTQTLPKRLDSSVEWEPIKENGAVKLKTRYGQYLRANGGLPPWRNTVTHDIPHRTATQEWITWEVHVMEILEAPSPVGKAPSVLATAGKENSASFGSETTSAHSSTSASFSRQESSDSLVSSPPKGSDGRLIYFRIADEYGEIDDGFEELCTTFKGNGVQELTKRLELELGIDGITVCTRSPLNGKLYPLRLQLPPNNTTMHVVVIPTSSQGQVADETVVSA